MFPYQLFSFPSKNGTLCLAEDCSSALHFLTYVLTFPYICLKIWWPSNRVHIRRFQEYFNHILIGSITLQSKWCRYFFLVGKTIRGDIRLYFKNYEKVARWHHHWNIWHLSVKTRISQLVVCYIGSNGCLCYKQTRV